MRIRSNKLFLLGWLVLSFSLLVLSRIEWLNQFVLYGVIPFVFLSIFLSDKRIVLHNKGLNRYVIFSIWASLSIFYTANYGLTFNYLSILLGNSVLWYVTYRLVSSSKSDLSLLIILGVSFVFHSIQGYIIPVEVIEKVGFGRATGMFKNSNALGFTMWYGIVTITALWLLRKNNLLWKVLLISFALLFVYVLMSSGSRKSAIAVLVFMASLLYFVGKSRYRVASVLIVVAAISLYFLGGQEIVSQTAVGQRSDVVDVERGGLKRFHLVQEGFNYFMQNPLLGIGLGSFTSYSKSGLMAHNDYIEVLASTGLPGILIYLSIYWHFFQLNRKLMRQPGNYLMGAILQSFLFGFLLLGMGRPTFLDPVAIMILAFFQGIGVKSYYNSLEETEKAAQEKINTTYAHLPRHQHA